ncbi:putative secreted protein of SCO1/SenC/PrrC family [Lunatimonas lonarensis]|uniref:Putative secreted protein of SCO1/SenC/PrrC family n=1 Tax=Lunatimonas lonarensis TaxID=1232681 RepID=R7ZPA4_9BACT|nr:SCO family protein [Lunatimonas lonarensis]EON75930.1 putative secreted protein of SCO1/SenC/PrrC family [Lunatimonas lonarensis]
MRYYLSFLFLSFLFSCEKNKLDHTSLLEETIDDLSIYQLPSVWNTQDGRTIEFKDLKGKPLVVVMIYTACRTACPRLVADMRMIEEKVSSKKMKDIQYVMVSIDPINDTTEKLKQFAKDNQMEGSEWLFLQGTENGVRDFANIMAVKYKQINPIDFSHSNIISVFDRNGVMNYQKEGLGLVNDEIVDRIIAVAKN